jgi:hypothetical protein
MVTGSERLGPLSDYAANCRPVLSSHLMLVPRSRIAGLNLHSAIRLHGIMLNYLSMGTFTFFFNDVVTRFSYGPHHNSEFSIQSLVGTLTWLRTKLGVEGELFPPPAAKTNVGATQVLIKIPRCTACFSCSPQNINFSKFRHNIALPKSDYNSPHYSRSNISKNLN